MNKLKVFPIVAFVVVLSLVMFLSGCIQEPPDRAGPVSAETVIDDWLAGHRSSSPGRGLEDRSENPPNILFILTDDQGWSQLSAPMDPDVPGAYSEYLETPNMTRLAEEGMRFASGYAPAPICTPTRRSILAGTTTARSGTRFASDFVPHRHLTIPMVLKQAHPDYVTAHFGKWGRDMISSPEQSGYDFSDGMTENDDREFTEGWEEYRWNDDPKQTASLTRRAIDFVREQATFGRPFFLQVSYYAVHLRVQLLSETLEKYRAKGIPDRAYTQPWAGMLEELDAGIGNLLRALDEAGIADNTYVFLMSDNGGRGMIPDDDAMPGGDGPRGESPTNYPLAGAKGTLGEGGIRVPFLVRGPGVPAGTVSREPVAGYDLLPTFYELAGGRLELPAEVDGVSLGPLLDDVDATAFSRPFGALVFHYPLDNRSAIRSGNYKLTVDWNSDGSVASRILIDLGKDIAAKNDISRAHPGEADELEKKLLAYLEQVDAEKPISGWRRYWMNLRWNLGNSIEIYRKKYFGPEEWSE